MSEQSDAGSHQPYCENCLGHGEIVVHNHDGTKNIRRCNDCSGEGV